VKHLLLNIELVPASSWFNNVRAAVSRAQWDIIRKKVYSEAYDTCQICGGVGVKHPVECHEIWEYNDVNCIQKLAGMIALCPNCHMVKHFGFAKVQGKEEIALKHLMKVNKITKSQAAKYLTEAMEQWFERSQKSWTVDVSYLSVYGIDINNLKYKSIV
jgi:hypothetical protein